MPRPLLCFVYLVVLAWSNHDGALAVATSDSTLIAGDAPEDTITDTLTFAEEQNAPSSIHEADMAGQRQEHAFASMEDMPETEPMNHPTFHAHEEHPPLLPSVDVDYLDTPNQDAPRTIATVNDPESADVTTNDMTLVSQSEDESENDTIKHDMGSSHNAQHQPDSHDDIVATPNARNVEVDNDEQLQAAAESIKEAIRMSNPHNVPTGPQPASTRDWNDAQTTARDETKHDTGNDPGPSDKDNGTNSTNNDSSTLHETKHDNGEAVLEEDDDRTLLDIFGESAKEYLTQRVVRV
jgi:hypothetical protein